MRVLLALLVAAQNPVVPPPPSPSPDTAHLLIVATSGLTHSLVNTGGAR